MIFLLKYEQIRKIYQFLPVFILTFLFCYGCSGNDYTILAGNTMGTTYRIKFFSSSCNNFSTLKNKINQRLDEINQSMSTYIDDSEISRFNRSGEAGKKFYISDDFFNVIKVAEKIYHITGGAWDGTIKPLVHLWGFDGSQFAKHVPEQSLIEKIVSKTGFNKIEVSEKKFIVKNDVPVTLDLASIAKGYGVDQIAQLIKKYGISNFIVEIGGEVYASGFKENGQNWQVGINNPEKNAGFEKVYKKLSLQNRALATSGDYRQFFEINGIRYSHVIDPRTGYPVNNGVVSVSILADKCVLADGLATAVMVMGWKQGLALVNSLDGVECLIITREKDDSFADHTTSGFVTS
ncbi:MAG: FAD:protein FMN transferase [Deltaproteobacteria bacterium]|nr:FAD:protein FMN transferase [Deltaproteobacteria bacterium]